MVGLTFQLCSPSWVLCASSDYGRDLIRRDQEREQDITDLKQLIVGEGSVTLTE